MANVRRPHLARDRGLRRSSLQRPDGDRRMRRPAAGLRIPSDVSVVGFDTSTVGYATPAETFPGTSNGHLWVTHLAASCPSASARAARRGWVEERVRSLILRSVDVPLAVPAPASRGRRLAASEGRPEPSLRGTASSSRTALRSGTPAARPRDQRRGGSGPGGRTPPRSAPRPGAAQSGPQRGLRGRHHRHLSDRSGGGCGPAGSGADGRARPGRRP